MLTPLDSYWRCHNSIPQYLKQVQQHKQTCFALACIEFGLNLFCVGISQAAWDDDDDDVDDDDDDDDNVFSGHYALALSWMCEERSSLACTTAIYGSSRSEIGTAAHIVRNRCPSNKPIHDLPTCMSGTTGCKVVADCRWLILFAVQNCFVTLTA